MLVFAVIQATVVSLATAQPVPQWQLSKLPLVSIGARDGDGPDVFGYVAGVQELGSGSIAIGDGKAKEVRFFSATGGHLGTIGRDGAGPGEFRYILSLRVCAGDSLLVHDLALRRLSLINREGRYARAIDLRDWIRRPSNEFACNRTGAFAMLSRDLSDPGRNLSRSLRHERDRVY